MDLKFWNWLLNEEGFQDSGTMGVPGTGYDPQPTPSSNAPKNFGGYKGNAGCRGGPATNGACPPVKNAGCSGGPCAKVSGTTGGTPATGMPAAVMGA